MHFDQRFAEATANYMNKLLGGSVTAEQVLEQSKPTADAAQVSHGTVRAILSRGTPSANGDEPQTAAAVWPASGDGHS